MANGAPNGDFYDMTKFNPDVCQLKHKALDKDLLDIKESDERNHQELKDMIIDLKKDINEKNQNLKNKIILTEKNIGDKIDQLDDFDDSLRGNGDPGIWETLRSHRWWIRILGVILFIMIILMLGGNFRGVSLDKIKEKVIPASQEKVEVPSHEHIEIPLEEMVGPPEPIDKKLGKIKDEKQ
ncbi:MAG: hypothetical protein ACTSSP_01080 [Candidatus Asgardarchaeia archaeon]